MPIHDYQQIQIWNLRSAWRKLFPGGAGGQVWSKLSAAPGDCGWGAGGGTANSSVFVATASSVTPAGPATWSLIAAGVGSATFAANALSAGSNVRLFAHGRAVFAVGDSLTLRVNFGGVTFATLGPYAFGFDYDDGFELEADFTVRSAVTALANLRIILDTAPHPQQTTNTAAAAVNLAIANAFDLTAQFTGAAAHTCDVYNLTIEHLHP